MNSQQYKDFEQFAQNISTELKSPIKLIGNKEGLSYAGFVLENGYGMTYNEMKKDCYHTRLSVNGISFPMGKVRYDSFEDIENDLDNIKKEIILKTHESLEDLKKRQEEI